MDMQKQNWKPYVFFIALAEAVGLLSGWLSREGQRIYPKIAAQASLAPPGWLFPVVWVFLYALMGFGAARTYSALPGVDRNRALNLFTAQLAVNFLWSPIFFNLGAYGLALVWLLLLLVLVAAMTYFFWKVDSKAALAQIPYLLWLLFAAYLNYTVWKLNL
jgi:tryptophan-rich sensory protein